MTLAALSAQQPTRELAAYAQAHPNDRETVARLISNLGATSDTSVLLALRTVFANSTVKVARQKVALRLWLFGDRDPVYFDDLLKYARDAAASSAPTQYEYVSPGSGRRPDLSSEFRQWCEANAIKTRECIQKIGDQPIDIWFLALTEDRRAIPVLRQVLAANNAVTVEAAVRGLAFLKDTDSIPLIAEDLARFPPERAQSIASACAAFDDPHVGPILDRFVTSPKWRKELDEVIRKRQTTGK